MQIADGVLVDLGCRSPATALEDALMRYMVLGRMIYAVGGNGDASRLAGIRVQAVSITVYTICAMLAAFAGIVVASQLVVGSANVGSDVALNSVAAATAASASSFYAVSRATRPELIATV